MTQSSNNGQTKKPWTPPTILETLQVKDARNNNTLNIVDGQINVGGNTTATLGS